MRERALAPLPSIAVGRRAWVASTSRRGSRPLLALLAVVLALPACKRDGPAAPAPPASAAPSSGAHDVRASSADGAAPHAFAANADTPSGAHAVRAGAARSDGGEADARGRALSPEARRALAQALAEGRRLAGAKKWPESVAALERARVLDPDEPRVLSDLGWAAFNAGDLALAARVSEHGMSGTHEPKLRAQMAYNAGRAAEARGDRAKAVALYTESVALRPHAAVSARLAALGADGRAPPEEPPPCDPTFPTEAALCKCLDAITAASHPFFADNPRTCEPVARTAGGEITILKQGVVDPPGETKRIAVGRVPGGVRILRELGSDFEPGAMGVHNAVTLGRIEPKTAGGLSLALIHVEQVFDDFNLGGLEEFGREESHVFVCVLADPAGGAPRCRLDVVVAVHDYARYEEPEDLDADMRAEVARRRKESEHDTRVKLDLLVAGDGKVTVRRLSGSADLIPAGLVGDHAP